MPRAALHKKDPLASSSPLARTIVRSRGRALRTLADALPTRVVFQHGHRGSRRLALTFDDGPGPLTSEFIAVLSRLKERATFFVIGDECANHARELEELVRHGHGLFGHGWSHTRFSDLADGALATELARTEALLPSRTGPRMVRPPFGTMTPRSLLRTYRAGYASAMWSFDTLDYTRASAEAVVRAADPAKLRNGDIVLLHEERRTTLDALPEIIEGLRSAGFELVTVAEILVP